MKTTSNAFSTLCAAVLMSSSLVGCSSGTTDTSRMAPVDDSNGQSASSVAPPRAKSGMSGGQKVVLLAGAAALYYLYKQNQKAHQHGSSAQPQYYLSKNGRVYYRESGGRVHWVTPPTAGIRVPSNEAGAYEQFQGYNGNQTGRSLTGMSNE